MADTLNQKVVVWASGQIGTTVDSGECWDLANRALIRAGAGSSADFGPMGKDADYVWGTLIPDLKDIVPGDILQYRDFIMMTTTNIKVTFSDKAVETEELPFVEIKHPHHTSIVYINSGNGDLTVLEQNYFDNKEPVASNAIRWKNASSTTIENKMVDRDGKKEMAKVETTLEIKVSGKIKGYRPKVK